MPCTDFQQYRKTSLKHFGSNTELSSLSKTKIKELSIHEAILLFSVQTLDYFACFWECLWNIMRFNLLGSALCIFRSSAKIPKKKWDTNDHLFGLVYLRAKMLNCCSMYCITNNENWWDTDGKPIWFHLLSKGNPIHSITVLQLWRGSTSMNHAFSFAITCSFLWLLGYMKEVTSFWKVQMLIEGTARNAICYIYSDVKEILHTK